MRVSYFDKFLSKNEELRKRYPRGMARILKRFYTTCYCTLTPWEDIEAAWVGSNINVPYFNDGYEYGAYGDWRGPVGTPMSDAKLEREGWCTTAMAKKFIEIAAGRKIIEERKKARVLPAKPKTAEELCETIANLLGATKRSFS